MILGDRVTPVSDVDGCTDRCAHSIASSSWEAAILV